MYFTRQCAHVLYWADAFFFFSYVCLAALLMAERGVLMAFCGERKIGRHRWMVIRKHKVRLQDHEINASSFALVSQGIFVMLALSNK